LYELCYKQVLNGIVIIVSGQEKGSSKTDVCRCIREPHQ